MANRLLVVSPWEWHQAERDRGTYYSACQRRQNWLSQFRWRLGRIFFWGAFFMWAGGDETPTATSCLSPLFSHPFFSSSRPTLVYSSPCMFLPLSVLICQLSPTRPPRHPSPHNLVLSSPVYYARTGTGSNGIRRTFPDPSMGVFKQYKHLTSATEHPVVEKISNSQRKRVIYPIKNESRFWFILRGTTWVQWTQTFYVLRGTLSVPSASRSSSCQSVVHVFVSVTVLEVTTASVTSRHAPSFTSSPSPVCLSLVPVCLHGCWAAPRRAVQPGDASSGWHAMA